jgi:hypothetical protein
MRCLVLLTFSVLAIGCAATEPSDAQLASLGGFASRALESQRTGICSVHHVQMHRERVPVEYGHLPTAFWSSWYHYAQLTEFPNAREYALEIGLGSQHTNRKAWRYVCPECKRAEREYIRKHPHDEFAKTLGPEQV